MGPRVPKAEKPWESRASEWRRRESKEGLNRKVAENRRQFSWLPVGSGSGAGAGGEASAHRQASEGAEECFFDSPQLAVVPVLRKLKSTVEPEDERAPQSPQNDG